MAVGWTPADERARRAGQIDRAAGKCVRPIRVQRSETLWSSCSPWDSFRTGCREGGVDRRCACSTVRPKQPDPYQMRYLVKARVKPGCKKALLQSIADGTLGQGSVAGDEYLHDMHHARVGEDGAARWIEVCFCATPLAEERPYWERYFELLSIKDAHGRRNCRDLNGQEPWACRECDCTRRLEEKLQAAGRPFLKTLQREAGQVAGGG